MVTFYTFYCFMIHMCDGDLQYILDGGIKAVLADEGGVYVVGVYDG
jgi:hypothetical protein